MTAPIVKSQTEIDEMRPAGELTARALKLVEEMVEPGVSTIEIDRAVEALIRDEGGIPAFLNYPSPKNGVPDYPASICASINEEIVHGIPAERTLKDGDIFSVDVGVKLNGWFGDAARTFAVGEISRKAQKLLDVTADCLAKATAALRPGVQLSKISSVVQETAATAGFSVVKDFVGHGIGREMHEPPQVPNYVSRVFPEGRTRLEVGTVLAVEPMVNIGGSAVRLLNDGWTVVTKDRTLSAHFENTIAIGEDGPIVLTVF